MPTQEQLQEVVVNYMCAQDIIETRHLPQIAIMFNLNSTYLQNQSLLIETNRISVDEAVTILQQLPKIEQTSKKDIRSCLQIMFGGKQTIDAQSFQIIWTNMNFPQNYLKKVMEFVLKRCPDGEISIDALSYYFEQGSTDINKRRMNLAQ